MSKPSIFTLTIENESPREFSSRDDAMAVVRERVAQTDQYFDFDLKETTFCRECGEEKRYRFVPLCNTCTFKMSPSVKAARKVIRSAKRHGNPVVSVNDGGDVIHGNEKTLLEAVYSVDTSHLIFQSGASALIVGNETESDCLADCNMSVIQIIEDANLSETH